LASHHALIFNQYPAILFYDRKYCRNSPKTVSLVPAKSIVFKPRVCWLTGAATAALAAVETVGRAATPETNERRGTAETENLRATGARSALLKPREAIVAIV
jgi:hypothetical protein